MNRTARLVLATVAGFVGGSIVNMALVTAGPMLIPPPAGADVATMEGLQASMHLFEPKHFLFPYLAHALGAFVGALTAAYLTPGRTCGPAYAVGVLFLCGGVAAAYMLPAPLWFEAVDLLTAYLPMAWVAHRLAARGAEGAPPTT